MSLQLERKYKINNFLGKEFKVNEYYTDTELYGHMLENIFGYYGKAEYGVTNNEIIFEKYYDKALDLTLKDICNEIFFNVKDLEIIAEHINDNIF